MKKVVALVLVAVMLFGGVSVVSAREQGGFLGFVVGCCFGIRSGAAYNEGKDLHWREWGLLIPVFSLVVGIMNGIDTYNGLTSKDLAAKFGASYY